MRLTTVLLTSGIALTPYCGDCSSSGGVTPAVVDADGDGYSDSEDCDDSNADAFPGNTEVCDGLDNDCDGAVDGAESVDAMTFYADADADGHGALSVTVKACGTVPLGYVTLSDDCDDSAAAAYPGAVELCDGLDNDCNGDTDEDSAADAATWYADGDGDGYGKASLTAIACAAPAGFVSNGADCLDVDAAINPGALEICDAANVDENCDGLADDADPAISAATLTTWYRDSDADGFGAAANQGSYCDDPSTPALAWVLTATDCNDASATTWPGAAEYCDGADTDCDGIADEDDALDAKTWFHDADADGFGVTATATVTCYGPADHVNADGDCDDAKNTVHPAAVELCDGIQNDCDETSWSAASENDTLSFEGATGWTAVDGQADFTDGAAPAAWSAPEAGTLHVCDGVFYGHVTVTDADVSVVGRYGAAVVDGGNSGRPFTVTGSTASLALQAMKVRNGLADDDGDWSYGGGVLCEFASLSVTEVEFAGNTVAYGAGGAIFLRSCDDTVIDDSIFTANEATKGGALSGLLSDDLIVRNSTFSLNTAAGIYWGGAVELLGSFNAQIRDTDFVDNSSPAGGGAVSVLNGTLTVTDSYFTGNTSAWGAAAEADNFGRLILEGCTIDGNEGTDGAGMASALYSGSGSIVALVGGAVSNNTVAAGALTGAAAVVDGGTLDSQGASWSDNDMGDVLVSGQSTPYDLGLDAWASCDDVSCLP